VISNFHEIRRDGKVIPDGMTGVQMLAAGWEPDKVLWLRWDWYGHPIELASPYGLLSRVVPNHEYLALLEDTDASGDHATLRICLPDGTIRENFPNILEWAGTADSGARKEAGEYVWFQTPKSPLPTAFAVVFKVYRNGATYRVDIDAETGAVLGTEEVH
jgi:hypothetical protein